MKKILVYSGQWNCTWLTVSILKSTEHCWHLNDFPDFLYTAAYEYPLIYTSDFIRRNAERIGKNVELEFSEQHKFNLNWFKYYVQPYIPNDQLEDLDKENRSLIMTVHNGHENTPLYQTLMRGIQDIDVVIPIRDPLLVLNTGVWRTFGSLNKYNELNDLQKIDFMAVLTNRNYHLLQIPKAKFILFDLAYRHDLGVRVERCFKLCQELNLRPRNTTEQLAQKNPSINGDKAWHKVLFQGQKERDDEQMAYVENIIAEQDLESLKKIYPCEIEWLQNNKVYNEKMQSLGFLTWWTKLFIAVVSSATVLNLLGNLEIMESLL